jgi:Ca2+-binding EF-hand superfamily protein
MEPYSLF